jgi:(E)-4-hydroxy-3-methylbut-2-enyl-diphosphate synthase
MADADFGYVGSGVGTVNLFVGHECVARHVPTAEATDRLIELIRSHGRWVDPPA